MLQLKKGCGLAKFIARLPSPSWSLVRILAWHPGRSFRPATVIKNGKLLCRVMQSQRASMCKNKITFVVAGVYDVVDLQDIVVRWWYTFLKTFVSQILLLFGLFVTLFQEVGGWRNHLILSSPWPSSHRDHGQVWPRQLAGMWPKHKLKTFLLFVSNQYSHLGMPYGVSPADVSPNGCSWGTATKRSIK